MLILKTIFWFSLFIVWYSYLGYGMLMTLLVSIKRRLTKQAAKLPDDFFPPVSLVIAAYNEADFIEKKIANSLALNYPAGQLKIIFVTDGSDDQTPDIVQRYPQVQLLHQPQRKGKIAAINRVMHFIDTPFVVFADANTLLNAACIKNIVRHYADPKVGAVAGEKKVIGGDDEQAAGVGEGLYWKYESYLKKLDSSLYTVVGAAGELFSMRTALFEKTPENVIIEDFVQSLNICRSGYVVRYEPEAYAMETASPSMKEEEKRKVRICAGAFQAMGMLSDLLNVFKYGTLSFQYISHRVLRWTLSPLCLVLLFMSNMFLITQNPGVFYYIFFAGQVLFYVLAVMGAVYANKNIKVKALYVPYYFSFMNMAVFMGFRRFLQKKQTVLWDKAARRT